MRVELKVSKKWYCVRLERVHVCVQSVCAAGARLECLNLCQCARLEFVRANTINLTRVPMPK